MKQLSDNYINLIYCDILYGTGKNFGDYQDLRSVRNEIEDFYFDRLTEMKRVLKETGTIYIQMDYRISHWIRCLLDDVFGYDNFQNEIIWHYAKMNAVKNNFISNHDNIFSYKKSIHATFNIQFTDNESALKQRLKKLIIDDKIYWKSVRNHKSQLMDNYIRSTKNRLDKLELDDEDVVIDFSEKSKQKMDDVWDIPIIKGNSEEYENYATQKPKKLLRNIIKASSNTGDIVADFFMGSGSTGDVSLELSRKFIGCDTGEKACKLTQKRLEKYT
jgi:site-specific DNA-methyltransferase (adenine-specific)